MPQYRSAHEAAWADELERLRVAGRIAGYEYEPRLLDLGGGKGYLPDFRVTLGTGRSKQHVWCEFKGHFAPHAQLDKLRLAARKYSFHPFLLVRWRGGTWRVTHVTPQHEPTEDLYPDRWLCWTRDKHGRPYPHQTPNTGAYS